LLLDAAASERGGDETSETEDDRERAASGGDGGGVGKFNDDRFDAGSVGVNELTSSRELDVGEEGDNESKRGGCESALSDGEDDESPKEEKMGVVGVGDPPISVGDSKYRVEKLEYPPRLEARLSDGGEFDIDRWIF
jgi:hypothetical protein